MREGITSDAFFDALRGFPYEELHCETRGGTLLTNEIKNSKEDAGGEKRVGRPFWKSFPAANKCNI